MVGGKTTNYKYNVEGIRTEKTVSGEYTDTYRLNGTQIVEMMRESGSPTVRLVFIYDENGRPYSLELYSYSYNLIDKYYYITNVQGDVIRLIDDNNDVVANYTYDAWGKLISITDASGNNITASNHIAIRNPIRYRGYIYDEDTKLYYCNSRYYDPQTRRFINADAMVSTGAGFNGYNMYAYCNNNPVILKDIYGYNWLSDLGNWFVDRKNDACNFINNAVNGAKEFYYKIESFVSQIDILSIPSAIADNFSMNFGVGLGVGGSVEVDNIGCNICLAGDILAGEITSKGFEETFEVHGAAQIDGYIAEFGPYFDEVHSADCQCLDVLAGLPCTGTYESGFMREKNLFSFGMSGYLLVGGRFEISFDPDGFWDAIYKGD